MNKTISFCTCCKGRLWQLKNTLPHNIKYIEEDMEIVILDYQSNDGLKEYLITNFKKELDLGKIKYYTIKSNNIYNYTSAFAKNVCHKLSSGKILMNLDSDNFIDHNTISDLKALPLDCLYIPQVTYLSTGQFGRLGYSRELFFKLKGYDETLKGLKGDDSFLRITTRNLNIKHIMASSYYPCIENNEDEKYKYTSLKNGVFPPENYPQVWGEHLVEDINNNIKEY